MDRARTVRATFSPTPTFLVWNMVGGGKDVLETEWFAAVNVGEGAPGGTVVANFAVRDLRNNSLYRCKGALSVSRIDDVATFTARFDDPGQPQYTCQVFIRDQSPSSIDTVSFQFIRADGTVAVEGTASMPGSTFKTNFNVPQIY